MTTAKGGRPRREWRLHGLPVKAETVREYVFRRDGGCLAALFEQKLRTPYLDRHVCGSAFSASNGGGLTFEHVTRVHGELDGRKNDEKHGVTLCGTLNGESMTLANRDMKEFFREYLRERYPACSS